MEEKEWLDQKDLIVGKVYNAYYRADSIYTIMVEQSDLSSSAYIHQKKFSKNGTFSGSFSSMGKIFQEASELECLIMEESIKNNTYTEVIEGQYRLLNKNAEYYTAAVERNTKLKWTEECEGIVQYIKEDSPVYIFGRALHRPKTFKELKELLWVQEQQ